MRVHGYFRLHRGAAIRWFLVVTGLLIPSVGHGATGETFADAFRGIPTAMPDGTTKPYPDRTKWAFTFWPGTVWPDSYGNGTNWLAGRNAECETYVTPFTPVGKSLPPVALRYDPFKIEPDGLHIVAATLSPEQQAVYRVGGYRRFGSGLLLSRFSFRYGVVSVIARLPSARGSWPALWMLPADHTSKPEIDIFEGMAWGPHRRQIHSGLIAPAGKQGTVSKWFDIGADPSAGFHEYGLDWTPQTTKVMFDRRVLWQQPTPAWLNTKMYLIVNLAVGGTWPYNELRVPPIDGTDPKRLEAGSTLIQADYPADMVVKSVKVVSP